MLHAGLHERLFGRERNVHRRPERKTQGQKEHSDGGHKFHYAKMVVYPIAVNYLSSILTNLL